MTFKSRCLLSASLLLLGCLNAFCVEFTIVGNATAPDAISAEEFKNVLLGNRIRWASGDLIKLAVLEGGEAHDEIIRKYTARSSDQFQKYWKKLVFTGKGCAPMSCRDEKAMLAYLVETPGSVGYISGTEIPAGLKVVKVE